MSDNSCVNYGLSGGGQFATTHWSVVLAAGSPSSPDYQRALSTLCRTYWFPLYAYLRRRGYDRHQAEDYAQAFFAQMLEKGYLSRIQRGSGKFRSFLLTVLRHFLADRHDRARAIKRGGGKKRLSLDFQNAESRYALEPAHDLSPEKVFERSWALTLLKKTMDRLETESVNMSKGELFDSLKVYVCGDKAGIPYRDLASKLNMTEGAVKVTVHRLRRRYREVLRDEIAQTVSTAEQIEEEIQDLCAALAR
jgi:RNA polymerase sigma factor (sigma-70 family)